MALSIPLLSNTGEALPYRNLILFITFIVILVTLVFQGLTLPELDLKFFQEDLSELEEENKLTGFRDIHLDILEAQRAQLTAMNHKAEFDEELIRKYLSLVDIEEFKVREKIKACK